MQYPAFLIAGPTASGKSALALELARQRDAIVINADSRQIYQELRILTSRPDEQDQALCPHRLYGHVSARRRYSVGQWLRDLGRVLEEARRERRLAVVVGGTGLYFRAALEGLAEIPDVPVQVEERLRAELDRFGVAALHRRLAETDPEMAARLSPGDAQRVVRALAVGEATGRPLSAWQRTRRTAPLVDATRAGKIVLAPDRAALRERIAIRFREMVARGAMAEAVAFAALDLDSHLPATKTIGVRELVAAAQGVCSLEEAIERAITETRRYAKRQETWFRNQMPEWPRHRPGAPLPAV